MKYNFTIITVVKNDKNGIIKTIRSVMSQSFKDFEYIVVDGNSSDGTLFQIRNLRKDKKNFKFIKRNDVSYYDSLNYAIGKSKGKFIGVLNSGDVFVNNIILKKINKYVNKNTELFYNNLVFTKNKNIIRSWSHKISKITNFNLFKIPHSTLFIKRDIYKKIGLYNLNYKIAADLDLIIRLNKNYSEIKHLNFNSIFMEYGGLSTNFSNFKLKLKEDLSILINHYKYYFIIFYFFKIYFKVTDFKFKNLIKDK